MINERGHIIFCCYRWMWFPRVVYCTVVLLLLYTRQKIIAKKCLQLARVSNPKHPPELLVLHLSKTTTWWWWFKTLCNVCTLSMFSVTFRFRESFYSILYVSGLFTCDNILHNTTHMNPHI